MMQKSSESQYQVRTQVTKRAGEITRDTRCVVIKVSSAALKSVWRNNSALELEVTCVLWSLETLAYYLKGCA